MLQSSSIYTPFTLSLHNFIRGLLLPYQSLRLLFKHPTLLLLALIPSLITFLLYLLLRIPLQSLFSHLLESLFQGHFAIVHQLLKALFEVAFFFFSWITFSLAATCVTIPFQDVLASATENYTHPPLKPTPVVFFKERLKQLLKDFLRTLFCSFLSLMILLLSWIPLMNLLTLTLTFLLISFQFLSYPQIRRSHRLKRSLSFLYFHFFDCIGLGASVLFLFSIPGLSIVTLPLATVSGTLLFARYEKS